ncbi:MAG: universal stress protein [Paracoccaceae bacterium]
MFDKILLPIDLGHPESWEKALPMARQCAGQSGEIHLLGIVHDLGVAVVSSFLPPDFERKAMEKLKADLTDFADTHQSGSVSLKPHVGHGHVPETILRLADQIRSDLIVLSASPPNELKTMLIGSHASKVVRHATMPVLVVR